MSQGQIKYFTKQTAGLKVDRTARRINGVAIAEKGIANGDLFDDDTLKLLCAMGNAGKIRARYDHPNRANPGEIEQTLDNLLGEHVNFRIEGDVCRADCVFAGVNIDKENCVMDFAEKAPHLFGLSVVIDMPAPPKAPPGKKPIKNAPCRPVAFFAADFVDLPSSNTAGLFAAKAAEGSPAMDADIYAKDGKLFCMSEGKEIPLAHTPESIAATKAQVKAAKTEDDDDPETETEAKKKAMELQNQHAAQANPGVALTQADIEKAKKEALEGERAYRKMFATVLKSTGLTGKAAEEFETTFDGKDEPTLKFFAKQVLAARGKGLGESAADEESPDGKKLTPVEEAEKEAGGRFDAEPSLRRTFGLAKDDTSSDAFKTMRGRYVASAKRRFLAK